MNMIMPDPLEKNASIEKILSAVKRPKSLWSWLVELFRCLGFRVIFSNTLWLTLASAGGAVCIGLLVTEVGIPYVLAILFPITPLLFQLVTLLIELTERASGLYDLKMSCKYTADQLTAVHLITYSGLSLLFCVFLSAQIDRKYAYDFFTPFALSLCALLLYGILSLILIRRFRWRWTHTAAAWGVLSTVPVVIMRMEWDGFLSNLPIWVTAGVVVLLLLLYLREIGKMISQPNPEVFKIC